MMSYYQQINLEEEWKYWYPRVYGYFFKRVDNQFEVEELTANTLNTSFLASNVKNFKGYLWRVAHNYLVTYIRTKSINPITVGWEEELEKENYEYATFDLDEEVENSRSKNYDRAVTQIIDCLDQSVIKDVDKLILQKYVQEELTSAEVAKYTGMQATTVRKRFQRLVSKVKNKCLELWKKLTK